MLGNLKHRIVLLVFAFYLGTPSESHSGKYPIEEIPDLELTIMVGPMNTGIAFYENASAFPLANQLAKD